MAICDIILLSWNNPDLVKKCIDSIFTHTDISAHLLIVDNASDQKTQTYLKSLKSTDRIRVTVDLNPVNEGYSKGMNRGLKQSTAPYVCLLNNDTEVSPFWLSRVIQIFEQNPRMGVMNPNSNIFGAVNPPPGGENYWREMGLCVGFCMFIRREVIDKIGYLDEVHYDRFFFEDSDYCKRAKEAGFLCALASNSYVYHAEHQSVNKLRTKEEIFKKNQNIFYQQWGKPKRILVAMNEWNDSEEQKLLPIARKDHSVHVFLESAWRRSRRPRWDTSFRHGVTRLQRRVHLVLGRFGGCAAPSQNGLRNGLKGCIPTEASIEHSLITLKNTAHTQLAIKLSPYFFLPFKWQILVQLMLKRKKPYDFVFTPHTALHHFLKKWRLLYRKPLITTWEELAKYV